MAKGARASSKKANRTQLRARVFGPAEKARAERIHAKLVETIQQPKPDKTDDTNAAAAASKDDDELDKEMDLDSTTTPTTNPPTKKNKDKSQSRKQLRRKPQNKISFPASRGKGALKPFTGGRVKKRS